ncbi:MAG: hypothetical protein LBS36_01875 [Oscillospiraceae bacterium]|jgi:hypothetical protein|nr:hypothetical protein [Oscillospiraceae bacterium]
MTVIYGFLLGLALGTVFLKRKRIVWSCRRTYQKVRDGVCKRLAPVAAKIVVHDSMRILSEQVEHMQAGILRQPDIGYGYRAGITILDDFFVDLKK